ncbi:MAG TPA: wax ester/triacylglycerol synthase domain-containing protein [Aquihabitans sp.]|jgi:WS/DGAT/MGAT family acyltransferase|nr:wax ester/triacylglycerol synthase domain-containing protein [Aquihabitans sp.]
MRAVTGRDAFHFRDEHPGMPRHTLKVLTLARPDGEPPVTVDEVESHLAARLGSLGPLGDRLALVGGRWALPGSWVRGEPRLGDHLHHRRLGPHERLDDLLGHLMATPLDRSRPPWELWLVDGPAPVEQALVLKVHHGLVGGAQSVRLIEAMFGAARPGSASAIDADPEPSTLALVRAGLRRWATLAGRSPAVARLLAPTWRWARDHDGRALGAAALSAPLAPWNVDVAGDRAVRIVPLPLPTMLAVARGHGATLNHVLLTLVGGALPHLVGPDADLEEVDLTATVPAERRPDDTSIAGNSGTSFGVALRARQTDPVLRLAEVRRSALAARARHLALEPDVKFAVLELGPAYRATYRLGLAEGRRRRRATYSLIVSLVRGPSAPLAVARSTVTSVASAGYLTEDMGLNVTAWSVGDVLNVGLTANPRSLDLDELGGLLVAELDALVEASDDELDAVLPEPVGARGVR